MQGKRVLLIVSGGIAAIKIPDLIRRLRERGASVRCVLTEGGKQFVTPLSLSALSEDKVYDDLFSLTDEHEMGHINLSREADVVLVAPASADILAKMAAGLAGDLATHGVDGNRQAGSGAPSMNVRMWEHRGDPGECRNPAIARRYADWADRGRHGVRRVRYGPHVGAFRYRGRTGGVFRFAPKVTSRPLEGRHAVVTSGPTLEPIDPVRYIANRSSGKQGHAIAGALAALGCRTTLVTGPTALADPAWL